MARIRHFDEVGVEVLTAEGCRRLGKRRLEEAEVAQPVRAALALEQRLMQIERLLGRQKLDGHLASLRNALSCAVVIFSEASCTRDFRAFLTGVRISDVPSVRTSRGVARSMPRSSRIGLSMMTASASGAARGLR